MCFKATWIIVCCFAAIFGFGTGAAGLSARFTDNADGTVSDEYTGLIWLIDVGEMGEMSWSNAMARCKTLKAEDFEWLTDKSRSGDWRLPAYHELMTLTPGGMVGGVLPDDHPFVNLPGRRGREAYWTMSEGFYDSGRAWSVKPDHGRVRSYGGEARAAQIKDKSELKYVWPVRGEIKFLPVREGAPAVLPSFDKLTEREKQRAELVELWDFKRLRGRKDFVVEETDAFLEVPPELAEWYPSERYTVAGAAPAVKLRILPNLEPEYFPEGAAYAAGWANWAKVTRSEDNRFFMAASDHRGRGAGINLYEYRPEGDFLARALNVSELLGWSLDMYTDGKIHGYMGIMPDGTLWAATHRGPTVTEEWYEEGYRGSWLLSYNIHTGDAKNWGVPLVGNSLPYFSLDTKRGRFLGSGENKTVLCWDVNEQRVRYAGYPPHGWDWYQVSVQLHDVRTGVFWGMDASEEPFRFLSFDPELNRFERHELEIPVNPVTGEQGRFTHNTKTPDNDGWYYCVTGNGTFFRFRPDGAEGPETETLGVTSGERGASVHQLVLCPENRYVYYVTRDNAAVVKQYDIATGEHKALAFLTEPFFRKYGFSIGWGTYGMNVSADGSFLVILANGSFAGRGSAFGGHPAVAVMTIPGKER